MIENWKDFFEEFTYKPNFKFRYNRDEGFIRERVVITMEVIDSRSRWHWSDRVKVPVTSTVALPPWSPGTDASTWPAHFIRSAIQSMEDHELDEWFRLEGELLFNPHKGEVRIEFEDTVMKHRQRNPGHSAAERNDGSMYCIDCEWSVTPLKEKT